MFGGLLVCRGLIYWFGCCGGLVYCVGVDSVLCWLFGWCCGLCIARLVFNSVGVVFLIYFNVGCGVSVLNLLWLTVVVIALFLVAGCL